MKNQHIDHLVRRRDATHLDVLNPEQVPITLLCNEDIPFEPDAIAQILEVVSLQGTLDELAARDRSSSSRFWGDAPGRLRRVVLTPDFHRGSGIPVGTVLDAEGLVIPQAVGNDICCGMRLLITDLTRAEIEPLLSSLERPLRGVFFQGKREIAMSPRQREALLRDGLWGLLETIGDNAGQGLWSFYDPAVEERALARVHFQGVLPAKGTFAFADFIRGSGKSDGRDAQIGSVGGGNHFVELQVVDEILDGATAHAWGIDREQVAIMVHSGSVGLGHTVGGHFHDRARDIYPKELAHPSHGFYVVPTDGPHAQLARDYLDAMSNAANFAFGNRLCLGLMATRVLSEAAGRRVASRLVYDAPHNLIWPGPSSERTYLHRKGACPALGPEPALDTPFRYTGHPVIIPGSMGASSFVLAGAGDEASLSSACHGAGRSVSRGKTHAVDHATYERALAPLRVVTPMNPRAAEVRLRRDILARYHERLREEAPFAYKSVTSVVETVEQAGVARRVARLWPLLTVKG